MSSAQYPQHLRAQRGTAAVEFALVATVLFMFIFGLMEVSRAMYLWSTMTAVTSRAARAAAISDFNSTAALRQRALFGAGEQGLILGGPIDHTYLRIDYLQADADTPVAPLPTCQEIMANCLNNPAGANCVRWVRVRLCQPEGGACDNVPYTPMLSFPGANAFRMNMPRFTALAPVESLGTAGACP
jgi:hypothetical protein